MNARTPLTYAVIAAAVFKASSALSAPEHVLYKGADDATGWEIKYALTPSFAWRLNGHDRVGMHLNQSEYARGLIFFNNKSLSVILDWHPLAGSFRASTGLFLSSQRMDLFVEPVVDIQYGDMLFNIDKTKIPDQLVTSDQSFNYNLNGVEEQVHVEGRTIDIDSSDIPDSVMIKGGTLHIDRNHINVSAKGTYNDFAPYLGFGWGSAPYSDRRVRYSFDFGVIYTGSPDVNLELEGSITEIDPILSEWLEEYIAEEEGELQKKANKYRMIPYISAGLSYAF
jgi:hypothetical protein